MKRKWTRGGPDGEVHTQHKGETWRVRKNYDHNDRHTGEYRIEVKKKNAYSGHDWHWHDTVHGKENAKSRLPEDVQEKISLDKKIDIEKAIKKLDKNQQIAIKMHFWQNATFSDIGKELGLSTSRARQILGKALWKLKHPASGMYESVNEEAMTTADAGIPHDTRDMGPMLPKHILRRRLGIPINMTDRRRKKNRPPVLLKRFSKYNG